MYCTVSIACQGVLRFCRAYLCMWQDIDVLCIAGHQQLYLFHTFQVFLAPFFFLNDMLLIAQCVFLSEFMFKKAVLK